MQLLLDYNRETPTLFLEYLVQIFKDIDTNGTYLIDLLASGWATKVFGFHGIHQCILDISFLLLVFDQYINDEINSYANGFSEKAISLYYMQNPNSPPLKGSDFYDERAQEAMEEIIKDLEVK